MSDSTDRVSSVQRDVGPQFRRVVWTCEGCKHLTTEDWVEYPDGERDSGTSAWCNAGSAGEKRHLSSYWSSNHQPPSICPYPFPALSIASGEGASHG